MFYFHRLAAVQAEAERILDDLDDTEAKIRGFGPRKQKKKPNPLEDRMKQDQRLAEEKLSLKKKATNKNQRFSEQIMGEIISRKA